MLSCGIPRGCNLSYRSVSVIGGAFLKGPRNRNTACDSGRSARAWRTTMSRKLVINVEERVKRPANATHS